MAPDNMRSELEKNKGFLNIGGQQKRRRTHQQGLLNNKGKAIATDHTCTQTQYLNTTHAIPDAFSPENQSYRIEQNRLPDACLTSDSTPSCSQDLLNLYIDIGDCEYACKYCNAAFWYSERLKSKCHLNKLKYNKCCAGGQVLLQPEPEPPITARDKVNDGTADEFKIQLYNVVGTREYWCEYSGLPSSGTLGAIVFQPDADSQTDYDIIIEYRDRRPQRINKLHNSYMSLQYPLLFVYGQSATRKIWPIWPYL
ncbi:hypothetical protein CTI12_AA231780 [Artemisia annua]|uniref:Helitron helicase-like domain-containing protein n=1 Tax=Artemisia annua TaxID=35608 RepID=A0A2U1NT87_ARTAN|nr:hypothetical protein CTI12_AA231780 [Artemisia annua]